METIFARYGKRIVLVIHAAAQPSHDWAANDPQTDFTVNANGTLAVLEATRKHAPGRGVHLHVDEQGLRRRSQRAAAGGARDAVGARPATSGLERHRRDDAHRPVDALAVRRLEGRSRRARPGVRPLLLDADDGVSRRLPDGSEPLRHKAARLSRVSHEVHRDRAAVHGVRLQGQAGTRQHPQLRPRQRVRPASLRAPRCGEVYNVGGTRASNCSMLEAIELCEEIARAGRSTWTYSESNRVGDHIWYISDMAKFKAHYPGWEPASRSARAAARDARPERRRAGAPRRAAAGAGA